MKKILFPFLIVLAATGCSLSEEGGASTDIPNIQQSCSSAKCTGAPMTMYGSVTVFSLSGCSQSTIDFEIAASGSTTVNCNGTNCNGIVSRWAHTNGSPITSFTSRTYYICSWIDFNHNRIKDSADEFSVLNQTVNSASVRTITEWGASAFYNPL